MATMNQIVALTVKHIVALTTKHNTALGMVEDQSGLISSSINKYFEEALYLNAIRHAIEALSSTHSFHRETMTPELASGLAELIRVLTLHELGINHACGADVDAANAKLEELVAAL